MCSVIGGSSLVCNQVLKVGVKDVSKFLATQGEALNSTEGPVVWVSELGRRLLLGI